MDAKEVVLKKLGEITFHDIPVDKISFKTEQSTDLFVDFFLYNEEKKNYDELTLKFIAISEMKMDELTLNSESDLEIFICEYKWDVLFEGKFFMLTGFAAAPFEIKVICQKVDLITTLLAK
ncbi:MAG: hypothetical protein ACI8ZM_003429 [Crocinitomix sp.]|jgi:hypothetical protein